MTAASHTSSAFAATGRTKVRWQRTLALLGICLPVPICAASGLTLPLPATIERIAASLVPWADAGTMSANEALRAGARGMILADPDERSENGVERSRLATAAASLGGTTDNRGIVIPRPGDPYAWPGPGAEAVPALPAAPVDRTDGAETVGNPTSAPQESSGEAEPVSQPAPTTSEPAPSTSEPVADDSDPVLEPIVDEVLAPAEPLVEETTKTLDETIEPVTGVLPGLGK